MPKTYVVHGMGAFARLFARHQRERKRRIIDGLRQVAQVARVFFREHVPVAFGDLRGSIHAESTKLGAQTIADAPHAAAVEVGSRPHTPPLAPLLAWVKLRGQQGLLPEGRLSKLGGTTTAAHARSIAGQLRGMERDGALSVDAPERIARVIQQKIAREGTMPHWFARQSLPDIVRTMDRIVRVAVRDTEQWPSSSP
jgi:hypothetical protein